MISIRICPSWNHPHYVLYCLWYRTAKIYRRYHIAWEDISHAHDPCHDIASSNQLPCEMHSGILQ